jgi:hypothetical protein
MAMGYRHWAGIGVKEVSDAAGCCTLEWACTDLTGLPRRAGLLRVCCRKQCVVIMIGRLIPSRPYLAH